jgi:hypothetical protein
VPKPYTSSPKVLFTTELTDHLPSKAGVEWRSISVELSSGKRDETRRARPIRSDPIRSDPILSSPLLRPAGSSKAFGHQTSAASALSYPAPWKWKHSGATHHQIMPSVATPVKLAAVHTSLALSSHPPPFTNKKSMLF